MRDERIKVQSNALQTLIRYIHTFYVWSENLYLKLHAACGRHTEIEMQFETGIVSRFETLLCFLFFFLSFLLLLLSLLICVSHHFFGSIRDLRLAMKIEKSKQKTFLKNNSRFYNSFRLICNFFFFVFFSILIFVSFSINCIESMIFK